MHDELPGRCPPTETRTPVDAATGPGPARIGFHGRALALIVCATLPATSVVAACLPADASLAARYASVADAPVSLSLSQDGRFRVYDLPASAPAPEVTGCWRREGDRVVFAPGADQDGEGIERVMPEPLTQADLAAVRGDGIETLAQAVDAGLLPAARVWAHQARQAGEPVRVKVFESKLGLAVGEVKLVLRLAGGQQIEASPGSGDGEFEAASLPAGAAVTAIGLRFPREPERMRWLTTTDPTKLLYLIDVDALAVGVLPGGPLTLIVQADGSLRSDTPDRIHFKREP